MLLGYKMKVDFLVSSVMGEYRIKKDGSVDVWGDVDCRCGDSHLLYVGIPVKFGLVRCYGRFGLLSSGGHFYVGFGDFGSISLENFPKEVSGKVTAFTDDTFPKNGLRDYIRSICLVGGGVYIYRSRLGY
jgi:hypothetical protein